MSAIPAGYALTRSGRLRRLGPAWAEGAKAAADARLGPLRDACERLCDERLVAEFIVVGKVVGKGRPRFTAAGGGRAYTPAKTVAYEQAVATQARVAMAGKAAVTGPVRLLATVYVAMPARFSARKRAAAMADLILPATKPDADNYLKLLCDAVNGILWKDDAQVVDATVRKRYLGEPGLHVLVEEL